MSLSKICSIYAANSPLRMTALTSSSCKKLQKSILLDPTVDQTPSITPVFACNKTSRLSRAVAFEGVLNSGEDFAVRILTGFADARDWPQLINIAADGESDGHHHLFGDMALAYALHHIESNNLASLTNYGEYLERYPPSHEVQIYENTSWSCVHGVERWRGNCGCNSGGHSGWNQEWRAPLREALDWLRDRLSTIFEEKAKEYLKDPWSARNDYIGVVVDRTTERVESFLKDHALKDLHFDERIAVLELMEIQRHAMLMYTSCGWFFDELSGIETVQVIQYAARAIQLADQLFSDSFEPGFLEHLERAVSNIPEHRNGRVIYEKFVRPAMLDMKDVGAHYAISSLIRDYSDTEKLFCYSVKREDYRDIQVGE